VGAQAQRRRPARRAALPHPHLAPRSARPVLLATCPHPNHRQRSRTPARLRRLNRETPPTPTQIHHPRPILVSTTIELQMGGGSPEKCAVPALRIG
jgi:hypothetical protein